MPLNGVERPFDLFCEMFGFQSWEGAPWAPGHLGGPAGDPSLLTAHSSTHCGPKSSHCGPESSAKLHFITLHCALDLLLPEELGVWLEVAGEQCVVQFIGFHEYKMLAATSPGEKRAGQGGGRSGSAIPSITNHHLEITSHPRHNIP